MPYRVVGGIPPCKSQRRRTGGTMRNMRSAVGRRKTRVNILQPVLLPAGNGRNARRRDMPVVWKDDIHHSWDRAQNARQQDGMRCVASGVDLYPAQMKIRFEKETD